jgi:hypothetical protein
VCPMMFVCEGGDDDDDDGVSHHQVHAPFSDVSRLRTEAIAVTEEAALVSRRARITCLFVFISGTMRFSRHGLGASSPLITTPQFGSYQR